MDRIFFHYNTVEWACQYQVMYSHPILLSFTNKKEDTCKQGILPVRCTSAPDFSGADCLLGKTPIPWTPSESYAILTNRWKIRLDTVNISGSDVFSHDPFPLFPSTCRYSISQSGVLSYPPSPDGTRCRHGFSLPGDLQTQPSDFSAWGAKIAPFAPRARRNCATLPDDCTTS